MLGGSTDNTTDMFMGPVMSHLKLQKPDGTVNGTGWDLMFAYLCHPGIVVLSYTLNVTIMWGSLICNVNIISNFI